MCVCGVGWVGCLCVQGLCDCWVHVPVSMPVCKHARVHTHQCEGMCKCMHAFVYTGPWICRIPLSPL